MEMNSQRSGAADFIHLEFLPQAAPTGPLYIPVSLSLGVMTKGTDKLSTTWVKDSETTIM